MGSTAKEDTGKSERLNALLSHIVELNPLHRQFLERALAFLTSTEICRLDELLAYFQTRELSPEYIAECYLTIVEDTLAEQMYFMRYNKYRCASYADVAGRVYHDPTYMNKYMYGFVVTAFFWPNHVEIARFFHDSLPRNKNGTYLEVGPGHGYYLATAASQCNFDSLLGVDISESSISQTREMLCHFAPTASKRCELRLGDFLASSGLDAESFDALVMGEVLEHVEQPEKFLCRLYDLAKDDAFVFISTCVNAPAVDHIFLWRSTGEIENLIMDCGFRIEKALRVPYEGKTLEQAQAMRLPINVAYQLRKIVS